MTRNASLLIWGMLYAIAVYYIHEESIKFDPLSNGRFFLEESLFRIQKFFFNTNILFTIFLYIMRRPFTSPLLVIRCQDKFVKYILIYGIKICLSFLIFTLFLHIGIPMLQGTNLLMEHAVPNIISLFVFLLGMYLLYLFILLRTNNQVLSILSVFVMNFLAFVTYSAMKYGFNLNYSNDLELNVLTLCLSMVSIVLILSIKKISDGRDHLN